MLPRVLLTSAFVLLATTSDAATPVLGPERVVVENARTFEIATSGEVHLAVWTDASGVVRAQILRASTGEPMAAVVEIAGPSVGQIAVGGSADGFLVAWIQGPAWGEVRAARVSTAGDLLDPGGILVRNDIGEEHGEPITVRHSSPVVIWAGTRWLVGAHSSISEYGQSWLASVSADGSSVTIRRLSRGQVWLATNGTTILAVTTDPDNDGLAGMHLLRPDGTATYVGRLSASVRQAAGLGALVSVGGGYAITFSGDDGYGEQHGGMWLSFIDGTTGAPMRTRGFAALPGASALAARGGALLIGWDEGAEVRLLRVSPYLEPVESAAGHPIFRHAVFRTLVVGGDQVFVLAIRGSSIVGRTVSY